MHNYVNKYSEKKQKECESFASLVMFLENLQFSVNRLRTCTYMYDRYPLFIKVYNLGDDW